jgi:DNA-binding NarL/FixJ family response regulator
MAGLQRRRAVAPDAGAAALHEPERLWYAALYAECLQALRRAAPSAERSLLTARAHYRLRQYRDALESLSAADAYFDEPKVRIERAALAAASCLGAGDRNGASLYLAQIRSAGSEFVSTRLRFEIDYTCALSDWSAGDFTQAQERLRSASPTNNEQTANAKILMSWAYAAQERFSEQAQLLEDAVVLLRAEPRVDVGLIARAAFALSSTARECFLPRVLSTLSTVIQDTKWTPDIALDHFQTLRLSAWAYALQGKYIRGIHQLQEARDIAPSPYFDVLSRFDGAWVSRIAGEQYSSTAQAARAFEVASSLNWESVQGEECTALLVGAELLASTSCARASQLLAIFEQVRNNVSPALLLRRDRRLRALESFARAVVAMHEADMNGVRHFAKAAYDIYASMGFEWRAARAALLSYRSGAGEEWLDKAMQHIADYPRSFIAQEIEPLHGARSNEQLRLLTARQREVCVYLMRGASIDEVAAALHCSRNTIRIHVGVIYRHFRARNRAEFMSKAAAQVLQ